MAASSDYYPPEDPFERARYKVIKLGDAVYSLKFIYPKLAAKLEKKLEQARREFEEMQKQVAVSVQENRGLTEGMDGFVYLIKAENGLYKIGKTKNVSKRMQPFSVSFPMKWELIHYFQSLNYTAAEQALHKKYADKRNTGEWFELQPEDAAYIIGVKDGQL